MLGQVGGSPGRTPRDMTAQRWTEIATILFHRRNDQADWSDRRASRRCGPDCVHSLLRRAVSLPMRIEIVRIGLDYDPSIPTWIDFSIGSRRRAWPIRDVVRFMVLRQRRPRCDHAVRYTTADAASVLPSQAPMTGLSPFPSPHSTRGYTRLCRGDKAPPNAPPMAAKARHRSAPGRRALAEINVAAGRRTSKRGAASR